jgi:uncharacterized membrane protein
VGTWQRHLTSDSTGRAISVPPKDKVLSAPVNRSVRRLPMSEYHRGPYGGPIVGGLPGLLVAVFCLILTVWFARMLFPLPVILGLIAVGIGFFVVLRLPRRARLTPSISDP